jgi:hypothetical protein
MTPDIIARKLLAAREFTVDVAGGKRIRLRRPAEMEVVDLLQKEGDTVTGLRADLAAVQRYAVGWEGITEADLVESGAADAVPFDAALFAVVIADRREWFAACAEALVAKVLAHEGLAEGIKGN